MSKSLGNFFTIRDVLDSGFLRHPEVLRFFLMSSHYRGPINYSLPQIDQADAALSRIYTALRASDGTVAQQVEAGEATARFRAAMDDDFNTPEALAVLQSLAGQINRALDAADPAGAARLATELRSLGAVLGLLTVPAAEWAKLPKRTLGADGAPGAKPTAEQIEALIAARQAARKARDFKRSDEIRDDLVASGVILEDKPGGVTNWRFQ
jgi:cysteinyl-tRNA synthetase